MSSPNDTNGQGSGLQHRMLTAFSLLFGPTEHVAALTIHLERHNVDLRVYLMCSFTPRMYTDSF